MKLSEDIIQYYLDIIKNKWLEAEDTFPNFLIEIPLEVKKENEQYLQKIIEEFHMQVKSYTGIPFRRKRWLSKTTSLIKNILHHENVIGIHLVADSTSIDAFHEELKEFLRQLRAFSPELSFEDIGQAIRNYIVYRMFKEIHNVKSGFSMAGFGYSMLYPFTDNYIDSDSITESDKLEYNRLIKDKLDGKAVHPNGYHHKKTCELLQAIEDEYGSKKDNSLSLLLLMMLDAQAKSISQQSNHVQLSPEERLDISIYKGGISVLIDRYLINKPLTEEDMIFYLGMGLFLQLADDLQDIASDSLQGWQTLFTLDLHSDKEELLINKALNFIQNVMASYEAENEDFKTFLLSNCFQLVYTSLAGSSEFFSKEYLCRIEKYLPVTYTFLSKMKKDMSFNQDASANKTYMKILDAVVSINL